MKVTAYAFNTIPERVMAATVKNRQIAERRTPKSSFFVGRVDTGYALLPGLLGFSNSRYFFFIIDLLINCIIQLFSPLLQSHHSVKKITYIIYENPNFNGLAVL